MLLSPMASAECDNDEKELLRQTWLYVPSSGSIHVQGFEESRVASVGMSLNCISSAVDAPRIDIPAVIAGKDPCARLCLPLESDCGQVDVHLQRGVIPSLRETNELLRSQQPTIFMDLMDTERTEPSSENTSFDITTSSDLSNGPTVLYVAQGEMAHCTHRQTDILVSDRATTCHVLALYSRSWSDTPRTGGEDAVPLCSMMHLDACTYDSCIRNAFEVHTSQHSRFWSSRTSTDAFGVNIDIHLVGGFVDNEGTSRNMSSWIMNRLIDIAQEYREAIPSLKLTLCTACVTAANHDPVKGGPVVRGLGLVCRTGQIMVAHCVNPGPAMTRRMARLWVRGHCPDRCDAGSQVKLSVVHSLDNELITIAPLFPSACRCNCGFLQKDVQKEFEYLLHLRDDETFLMYCSTSPAYEEDDFCKSTRASFRYILQHLKQAKLAANITPSAPRHYCRAHSSSNMWLLKLDDPTGEH